MGSFAMNCWWRTKTGYPSATFLPSRDSAFTCRKLSGSYDSPKFRTTKLCSGFGANIRAFASRNSVKKLRRQGEERNNVTTQPNKSRSNEYDGMTERSPSGDDYVQDNSKMSSFDNLDGQKSIAIPSRSSVLQACTVTSSLIAALGVTIRQVSHVASIEGLPIVDCSAEVSFGFEMWHLQLITGLVILISSCRYLLLKTWPDFAESSEAANQQVLTSLQPLDYMVVAFLPGISEELLFRGALLPLFGINWKSALVVATLFGVLHLGSGRKYSFAIWATFVGFAYGYVTIVSSSVIVPMASHAANNLVGGIIWKYTSKSSK
uniref:CAAX prenyl protease 2/Lysostaphin resistance protein A-like domain-containing protein n=1 Tax=Davidia involucrata TaxID=16924 RepID=A0A5B7BB38_DAVIN